MLIGALSAALPASAQGQPELRAYIFGNSLINHVTETTATTMPYWLGKLANAAGKSLAVDGQWGFLRDYPKDLPPTPVWQFQDIPSLLSSAQPDIGKAGLNAVIFSPENFIQSLSPNAPFEFENPARLSPVDVSLALFDGLQDLGVTAPIYIYEGWADMAGFSGSFPPYRRALKRYHAYNLGKYHQWFLDYQQALATARPDLDIRLIPTARLLSDLLSSTPLQEIAVTDLYSDDAPHGTPNLYFLAAYISYGALYGERPPVNVALPDYIHPLIRDNLALISDRIAAEMDLPVKPEPQAIPPAGTVKGGQVAPAKGVKNPSLGMGLNGISDWSTQQPFLNLMKSARPWVGHLPGQWGGMEIEAITKAGVLDGAGWPMRIPKGVRALEALILTDQPAEASSLRGRYRLRYQGSGRIKVTGLAENIAAKPGEIWFDYKPGDGSVGISISVTDPDGSGDYIRDISVVRAENIALFQVGMAFNPLWIAQIRDLRLLRFMDWMGTNGSLQQSWQDRPRPGDYTYGRRGVPLEIMLELANVTNTDPWFTLPHKADDDYMRRFAMQVREGLNKDRKAYVEYSNEMWNFIFPQTEWAVQQARLRWGAAAKDDAWMQFAGLRAAQMARIWGEVFGAETPQRLVRVIATHTGWPGLEEPLLQAPLWQAETPGNRPPVDYFDAYAVSGYFGSELGTTPLAPKLLSWITEAAAASESLADEQGLEGQARQDFLRDHQYDAAIAKATAAIRQGSLKELKQDLWPYQARVAQQNDLQLLMYEGGSHVTGQGGWVEDQQLTDFFAALSYSPEMAGLYSEALARWQQLDGQIFNGFVDVAKPSKWGSWGALRYLGDRNPRYDVLIAANRQTAGQGAGAGRFTYGDIFGGTAGDDVLAGSEKADVLLGRGGDDVLMVSGDGDRLHGGSGQDLAVFPGALESYSFTRSGGLIKVSGPGSTSYLFAVERLRFAQQPGRDILVSDIK